MSYVKDLENFHLSSDHIASVMLISGNTELGIQRDGHSGYCRTSEWLV